MKPVEQCLWSKPEHDPDWIAYQRIREWTENEYDEDDDDHDANEQCEVYHAIGNVYYDVFNNGGGNLPDNSFLAVAQMILRDYAEKKNVDCPEFVVAPDEDGNYDLVTAEDMDDFARLLIRHLYLDITHE